MDWCDDTTEKVAPKLLEVEALCIVTPWELASKAPLHGITIAVASFQVYAYHLLVRYYIVVGGRPRAQHCRKTVVLVFLPELFERLVEAQLDEQHPEREHGLVMHRNER